jgi:hypothetical protein
MALVVLVATWSAAASAGVDDALRECRSMSDTEARLHCYDAIAVPPAAPAPVSETVPEPATPPSAVTEPAAAEAGPVASPVQPDESRFGLEDQLQDAPSQLIGTVSAVDRNAMDRLVLTLENGQVWQQSGSERLFVDPGDVVYIHRGALTAFYLSTSENGRRYRFSRVR